VASWLPHDCEGRGSTPLRPDVPRLQPGQAVSISGACRCGKAMRRICVLWPRFGPYHLARLKACHSLLSAHGIEVVGIETAAADSTYAWRSEEGATSFRREQIFGRPFEELAPEEVRHGMLAMLERLDPDAVAINSYSFPDSRAALEWCRRCRRTAVLMMESKRDDAERTWVRELPKAVLVRQYDAALVGGSPQREYLLDLGFPHECITVGYDVVDNHYFQSMSAAARANPGVYRSLPGLDDDTPYFLASSRFVARKNLPRLLMAYRVYRDRVEAPWRLLLLGDGPQRQELESLVREQDVAGVRFCGFRQIDELPAYYAFAGALVHVPLVEQWGLVVNEGMACGLPVLVSKQTGCSRDLVRHDENGLICDGTSVQEIAELMVRLSADACDRSAMSQRSLEIISHWSPEQFATGLWTSVQAGSERSMRSLDPAARLILATLRMLSRRANSFHALND
jgi:glycosyltransferase involved in cell wall biosynthesis